METLRGGGGKKGKEREIFSFAAQLFQQSEASRELSSAELCKQALDFKLLGRQVCPNRPQKSVYLQVLQFKCEASPAKATSPICPDLNCRNLFKRL